MAHLSQTSLSKNNTSPFILAAILLAGVIGGYLYYSRVLKESVPPQVVAIPPGDTLAKFKEVKLDFSTFDDPRFKVLKIFGESPVQPGASGKNDLFAPF